VLAALVVTGALGVTLALVGGGGSLSAVDAPSIPPELTRLAELAGVSSASSRPLVAAWNKGHGVPLSLRRELAGWVELDGVPHARLIYRRDHERRHDVFCEELLRLQPDAIACSRRVVGSTTFELDPPQPILKLPLTPGSSWSWEGRVGVHRARAEFRVLPGDPERPTRIEVEQVTTLLPEGKGDEPLVSTRRVAYGLGVGFAEESGQFPVGEAGMPVDWLEAEIAIVDSATSPTSSE